jgi:hypothetical protein
MLGTSHWLLLCVAVASACGTGETRVDPADLEVRDLLGVAPEVAARWDASQREAARHVLGQALHAQVVPQRLPDVGGLEERLADLDARRADAGEDALGLVVVDGAMATPVASDLVDTAQALQLALDDSWRAQPIAPDRGLGVLATFGADAGHVQGPLVVLPAPRLAAIAGYERGRLVVNPVVLAALEPVVAGTASVTTTARLAQPARVQHVVQAVASAANGTIGNPYSFYGSVSECAATQRSRCEACLPATNCVPVTNTSDGNAECTMFGANGGRGYYLICINAALAITAVDRCAAQHASSCARNTNAADSLSDLEANADFLDDPDCNGALDTCLATIYGQPSGSFPGPGVDAGTTSEPPRSTNVSCGDSYSNNKNCEASPNCNCSGPSCNNSLSCDSTCASSNNSSGCNGASCDSCSSSSSSSSGGGGGGCSSDSSSSGGSSGGGCNSCSSNSSSSGGSSGGGCNSCSSDSSSSGGSSGCNSCSSNSSSSSSSSGCSGSGGKCGVARGEPSAAFALLLSIMWGVMPVPFAAFARRRARRARKEVQS